MSGQSNHTNNTVNGFQSSLSSLNRYPPYSIGRLQTKHSTTMQMFSSECNDDGDVGVWKGQLRGGFSYTSNQTHLYNHNNSKGI